MKYQPLLLPNKGKNPKRNAAPRLFTTAEMTAADIADVDAIGETMIVEESWGYRWLWILAPLLFLKMRKK